MATDGVTPVQQFVMVDDLGPDSGYFCELTDPLFLAPGDRILFDGFKSKLIVTRRSGETFSPAGKWGVRCTHGHARF
ncbi:hypothetical protein ACFVXG_01915 [Kitasatospora sp. NPDC058162]|uniref:hypothetical protein n=1 Tax=Kitasatospora sp. NPDC058162 TaxID=3346362 RepID=UPI0036DF98A6